MSLCSDITCCCNRPIRITLTPFQQHVLPCHAWSIVLQCMIPVQIRTVKKVCVWVFAVLCFWKGKPNTMNSKILIGHLLGTLSFTNSIFKFSLTVYRLHCYLSSRYTYYCVYKEGDLHRQNYLCLADFINTISLPPLLSALSCVLEINF